MRALRLAGNHATTEVCDALPVRRQTYGYLPRRRASPPFDRYPMRPILFGDRAACVCEQLAEGCRLKTKRPQVEPATV